ncbi:exodeoxyribonuclease VII small subunit [Aliiglaciecola litoralis]|uniref:Exodeoxyribonuclease 7 small subunit n=1 Tax=Aliiglaciecola litoralis TaxID=582857 RepID=A0ABP3WWL3_9ALTE
MSDNQGNSQQSFEEAMLELEKLVAEMETGDLPLEQALSKFERGIALARTSQTMLKKAEQRVQVLTQQGDDESLQPLSDPQA